MRLKDVIRLSDFRLVECKSSFYINIIRMENKEKNDWLKIKLK